jgi:hypothetical protein
MLVMADRAATGLHEALQAEVSIMKEREVMSRMMAVCVFQKAGDAKIIVFAVSACDHLSLLEILETRVADPLRSLKWVLFSCSWSRLLDLFGSRSRLLDLFGSQLR